MARSTDHTTSYYVFFSIPLLPRPLRPKYILLHSILQKYSILSPIIATDHISHPYKTTDKIVFMYILATIFFSSRLEEWRFWAEYCHEFTECKLLL